jgi:hypothetical protein
MKRIFTIIFILLFCSVSFGEVITPKVRKADDSDGGLLSRFKLFYDLPCGVYVISFDHTETSGYVILSAYGTLLTKQKWFTSKRVSASGVSPAVWEATLIDLTIPSMPAGYDCNRYKKVSNGILDTVGGVLRGNNYANDPTPLCTLIPAIKDGVIVGFMDFCNNKLYDMEGNPVDPLVLGLIPFYSDGVLLGYIDSNGNWKDKNGGSNPMEQFGHFDADGNRIWGWKTPDGRVYRGDGTLWTEPQRFSVIGKDGVLLNPGVIGNGINIFGFTDDGKAILESNGKYYVTPYRVNGTSSEDGATYYDMFIDLPVNLTPATTGGGGYFSSLDDNNYITLPSTGGSGGSGDSGSGGSGSSGSGGSGTGGSDPNPDPDPDPDPDPEPPDVPEPPTPPDPGVGGTVNQYNEITQNNDYYVTNNDNRTYNNNYDFNDTGSYSADGMFSDLSLSNSVPSRISQRMSQMMTSVGSALGVAGIQQVMRVSTNSSFGKFCIDNKELSELQIYDRQFIPYINVCVDFDDMASKEYIKMIRTALLFIVFFMFVSSVYSVLCKF